MDPSDVSYQQNSNMTETTRKRKRAQIACETCRKHHIACDNQGTLPCKRCIRLGLNCAHATGSTKRTNNNQKRRRLAEAKAAATAEIRSDSVDASSSNAEPDFSQRQNSFEEVQGIYTSFYSSDSISSSDTSQSKSLGTDSVFLGNPQLYQQADPRDEEIRKLRLELLAATTQIQQLEGHLRFVGELEEYFDDSDNAPACFLTTNPLVVVGMNKKMCEKLGYSEEDFSGHNFPLTRLIDGFDIEQTLQMAQRQLEEVQSIPNPCMSFRLHMNLRSASGNEIYPAFGVANVKLDNHQLFLARTIVYF